MATFVLCHGAWTGGWNWRTIPDLLRIKGHRVFTPTFTGLGERVHLARPDVDLNTHITDVVNVILFEELRALILVGFSYGGMVITGVADRIPDRIAHLVYLDAVVPQDGQSLLDLLGPEITDQALTIAKQQGDGWKVPDIPDPGEPVDPRVTPQPLKTLVQPVRLRNPAARSLPRSFIYCTEGKDVMLAGRPVTLVAQAAKTDASWHYYELQMDHHPIRKAPEELSRLLITIAAHSQT